MDGLEDFFLRPVEGHGDILAFRHDFFLEGKAAGEPTVSEVDDGDLIIEGWAASFEGLDREKENFVEGAFQRGIKSFLEGQAALCFHHKHDHVIGRVLDLKEVEGKGLWMRARVDSQVTGSPLYHIYQGIKKGSINALSVGGFFKRALVHGRKMIQEIDFTEVSACGVPVHPKTKFAVVAGKALTDDLKVPEGAGKPSVPENEIRDEDFARLQFALDEIGNVLDRIQKRATGDDETEVVVGGDLAL